MNLPSAPLERLVRSRHVNMARWGEADRRAYQRAITSGTITDTMADRLCIKHLDIQPKLLWPQEWATL